MKPASSNPPRDADNMMFNLAIELVTHSNRSIFLTGKAGTGKTTFLKWIRDHCLKQLAIVAPTGVAAINAGGVTIHSFFQLPLAAFIPEGASFSSGRDEFVNPYDLVSRLKIQKEKAKVLEELELLIIDEVSMVRSDTIDAINTVLKHVRQSPEPFGGVQVLFIGDMYQLPPVIRDETWDVLQRFYPSPYFFDSQAVSARAPVYIEFDKIYRQSEEKFIRLLNQVRNNELDEHGMGILKERYQPAYKRTKGDGVITLTTHNEKAREINNRELDSISTAVYKFDASIDGEFPDNFFPADQQLVLKIGAQVMFIKNDPDRSKRYFNGKIGVVTDVVEDLIHVQCLDGSPVIEVKREKWENIRYMVNASNRKLEEDVLGSFGQYPLRLAWAITIHKSQGLTFEKAIIDAGRSFASGQVYVALSRCTNLEGLVLQSRIQPGGFFTDRRIVDFSSQRSTARELEAELLIARKVFIVESLNQLFGFGHPVEAAGTLAGYILVHESSFGNTATPWVRQVIELLDSGEDVASRFRTWLSLEFGREASVFNKQLIEERIGKASAWFVQRLDELLKLLKQSPVSTDSTRHAREFNESVREIHGMLALKRWMLVELQGLPDAGKLQEIKSRFQLPAFTVNAYGGQPTSAAPVAHPALQQLLRKVRDRICSKRDLPVYLVAASASIDEMADYLPLTPEDLQRIKGFGPMKARSYGLEFLEVIIEYCEEHGLESRMDHYPGKEKKNKERKTSQEVTTPGTTGSSSAESFRLFRTGLSLPEIASERKFTVQTIESHLAAFISTGELSITELLGADRIAIIEPVIMASPGEALSALKEKLGKDIRYAEIRFVLAWIGYKRSHEAIND